MVALKGRYHNGRPIWYNGRSFQTSIGFYRYIINLTCESFITIDAHVFTCFLCVYVFLFVSYGNILTNVIFEIIQITIY